MWGRGMECSKKLNRLWGVALCALACSSAFAITPNPIVSMGKPLYVSGMNNFSLNPLAYTDGILNFDQIAEASDFALNVGFGPKKLFITWDARGDEAWASGDYVYAQGCVHNWMEHATLQNFKVLTSANSTNGIDGDWEIVAQVGESGAASRGIAIDFDGKSWFRIVAAEPVANLEEVSAYDISNDGDDTWFFLGTSITQMGMKQFVVDSNFSQLIHARYPNHYPAMVRGGIACVTSQGVVDAIKYYVEYAGNVKFWAIELGTNDTFAGNGVTVEMFEKNLQTIVDTAIAHGITPIIARLFATNLGESAWQVHEHYLAAIDRVVERNNLLKGPDFSSYFAAHPEEIDGDGIHPANPAGGQSMHRLWAEAVAPFYDGKKFEPVVGKDSSMDAPKKLDLHVALPQVSVEGRTVSVARVNEPVAVAIVDLTGNIVWHGRIGNSADGSSESSFHLNAIPAGNYIVRIRGASTSYKTRISIR